MSRSKQVRAVALIVGVGIGVVVAFSFFLSWRWAGLSPADPRQARWWNLALLAAFLLCAGTVVGLTRRRVTVDSEASIAIAAPIGQVFDAITDPARSLTWSDRFSSLEVLTPGAIRRGTRLCAIEQSGAVFDCEVTELEPPRYIRTRYRHPLLEIDSLEQLEEVGTSHTRYSIRSIARASPRVARSMRRAARAGAAETEESLERMRADLEASSEPHHR